MDGLPMASLAGAERDSVRQTLTSTLDNDRLSYHVLRLAWWRAVILGIGLVLGGLLALPGGTATTKYVNDLLVFLDGAHRIASGQVPNVDFHTSLGPLTFYIPAVGYGLSGSMGDAMPVGMALLVLLFS